MVWFPPIEAPRIAPTTPHACLCTSVHDVMYENVRTGTEAVWRRKCLVCLAVEEAVANLRKRSTYPFVRMHYPPGKDSATKYRAVAVSALDALRGVPLATDILSEQTSLGTSAILRHPRLVARALLSDMVIHNWKLRGMRNDLYID